MRHGKGLQVALFGIGALSLRADIACQSSDVDVKDHVKSILAQRREHLDTYTVSVAAAFGDRAHGATWAYSDWSWNLKPSSRWLLKYSVTHGGERGLDVSDLGAASVVITPRAQYRFWVKQRCYARMDTRGELASWVRRSVYGIMWGFAPELPGYTGDSIEGYPVDILELLDDSRVACVRLNQGGYVLKTLDGRHTTWLRGDQRGLHAIRREWRAVSGRLSLVAIAGQPEVVDRHVPHGALQWTVCSYEDGQEEGEGVERVCSIQPRAAISSLEGKSLAAMLAQPGMVRYDPLTNSVLQVTGGGLEVIEQMGHRLRDRASVGSVPGREVLLFVEALVLSGCVFTFAFKKR